MRKSERQITQADEFDRGTKSQPRFRTTIMNPNHEVLVSLDIG